MYSGEMYKMLRHRLELLHNKELVLILLSKQHFDLILLTRKFFSFKDTHQRAHR